MPRWIPLAFIAGFFAVLCFHQPMAGLLHAYAIVPFAPYGMTAVPPLGIPQWLSASFWGGIWGIVMLWIFTRFHVTTGLWWKSVLFGGIALTLVALFIVFPLKGRGLNLAGFPIGFLVNGAWGMGIWVFARCFGLWRVSPRST
ncbi:hypothetical protein [Chromohalobacter japonicus]|nr:hypothetical protein [Chromohalobacter japonicus]